MRKLRRRRHYGLERKRMKRACCELENEKRKFDQRAVLRPIDDGNLDISSRMV